MSKPKKSYNTLKMDRAIRQYVAEHPSEVKNFLLDADRFPPAFTELADMLYPDPEYFDWLIQKNVYGKKSPLEVLSELDPKKLRENTDKMHDGFARVLSFTSVNSFPTLDQVFYETRLAQYKQLGFKLE